MLNERKAGRLAANIGLEKIDSICSSDFCRHAASAYCVAVDKRHLRLLSDEAPHGGFPDPGRSTGHGSDHSIQLSHCRFLYCLDPGPYEPKLARYKIKLIPRVGRPRHLRRALMGSDVPQVMPSRSAFKMFPKAPRENAAHLGNFKDGRSSKWR